MFLSHLFFPSAKWCAFLYLRRNAEKLLDEAERISKQNGTRGATVDNVDWNPYPIGYVHDGVAYYAVTT